MKKSRIFVAASTFVLLLASIFAAKANRKFVNGPATVYAYNNAGSYITVWAGATTDNIITTASNSNRAILSGSYYLYTSSTGGAALYVKTL